MAYTPHYLLIIAVCILCVESADPIAQFCNQLSNTTTPEITKNIDSVLAKLVQNTPQSGYNLTESGEEGTEVQGLGQCRGDVPSKECSICIQTAAEEIKKICPNRVDARLWYEHCLIRYDTKYFAGDPKDQVFRAVHYNVEYVTEPKNFKKLLFEFVDRIFPLALEPGNKGLGKGEMKLSDSVTLYLLFQCTRDMPRRWCEHCGYFAKDNYHGICENKKGCRAIYSHCYARYELYPFFFSDDHKLANESSSIAN